MKTQLHKEVLGIIPARYHSTRLEGKPLLKIDGKPMIQHVYDRASKVLDNLLVATDDLRIVEAVRSFNGNVLMTSSEHTTGTSRCLEAFNKWQEEKSNNASIVLNIQGDEPLLDPLHIDQLIKCFDDPQTTISTIALKLNSEDQLDEGKVYLVKNNKDFAMYFSRYPIPFIRDLPKKEWSSSHQYFQHIGIYGFKKDSLYKFSKMNESLLEKAEKLEQLRWLESGEKIKVTVTNENTQSVDTKEDLEKVRAIFKLKRE